MFKNDNKILSISLFGLLTIMTYSVNLVSIDDINAQKVLYVGIGNNTNMADDTFFQLDDSISKTKNLVNNTLFEINTGNTTGAQSLLTQIYGELTNISANSNNLVWDESNKGS
jgi:hypothetical protein